MFFNIRYELHLYTYQRVTHLIPSKELTTKVKQELQLFIIKTLGISYNPITKVAECDLTKTVQFLLDNYLRELRVERSIIAADRKQVLLRFSVDGTNSHGSNNNLNVWGVIPVLSLPPDVGDNAYRGRVQAIKHQICTGCYVGADTKALMQQNMVQTMNTIRQMNEGVGNLFNTNGEAVEVRWVVGADGKAVASLLGYSNTKKICFVQKTWCPF